MKKLKIKDIQKSSGITLIALIVTIIVLLILAGISISMLAGDNSILQKATTAKENTDSAQIRKRIQLAYHSALTGGQGSYTKDTLMNELENEFKTDYDVDDSNKDNWTLYAHGQSVTIPAGEKEQSSITLVYTLGQEVSIDDEQFYVITKDDDESKDTITVLSKYNLNKSGNAQTPNVASNVTSCAFSSNNYWAVAHSSYTEWNTQKLDVNGISGNVSGDAVTKSQTYAISKGGNGRLLTYEEADDLINQGNKTANIIWGTDNSQEYGNFLVYWLGSSVESGDGFIWAMDGGVGAGGTEKGFGDVDYFYDGYPGVRPVIEILKSKISE